MRTRTSRCPNIQSDRMVNGVDNAKMDSMAVAQLGDGRLTKPHRFETPVFRSRQAHEGLIRGSQNGRSW
jgi:hypothetical protein